MNKKLQYTDCQLDTTEIIRRIMEAKGLKNKDVAGGMKISEQNYSNMLNGHRTLTDNMLAKISEVLKVPFETLKHGKDLSIYLDNVENIDDRSSASASPRKEMDSNTIGALLSRLPKKQADLYVPFYDIDVTAGRFELFDDIQENPTGYIYAPEFSGCVSCRVKGDSMYDRIYPGATAFIYYIANKKYIDYGQIYLIVLDGYRVLKYIRAHTDPNKVWLVSQNKNYQDWEVDKADIIHLFLVKGYWNQTSN